MQMNYKLVISLLIITIIGMFATNGDENLLRISVFNSPISLTNFCEDHRR